MAVLDVDVLQHCVSSQRSPVTTFSLKVLDVHHVRAGKTEKSLELTLRSVYTQNRLVTSEMGMLRRQSVAALLRASIPNEGSEAKGVRYRRKMLFTRSRRFQFLSDYPLPLTSF